jgi:hypothetical protein
MIYCENCINGKEFSQQFKDDIRAVDNLICVNCGEEITEYQVVEIEKEVYNRFLKYQKDEGNDLSFNSFVEINLGLIGY